MFKTIFALASFGVAIAFTPLGLSGLNRMQTRTNFALEMKLAPGEKVVVIGVAADSGCGKSTFMRRLTKVFGGKNVGPLGGGFGAPGGWETNTLVSDKTTVICLDDYHANDRQGRKKTGLTALHVKEQNFDLMYEHMKALKSGQSIKKPIYNHVNGTLDTPETVEPTPIVIIEGLHPLVDPRVRELLDFTIYLDISDDIKFAWKIQRDMAERKASVHFSFNIIITLIRFSLCSFGV
jgi:phosphoribulokinase